MAWYNERKKQAVYPVYRNRGVLLQGLDRAFYPEGIKDGDMLEFYSRHFDFTEVNSSYYHMPGLGLFKGLDKNPENFRFQSSCIKGSPTIGTCPGKKRKCSCIHQPISDSGKLVCILAQFPYSFHLNAKMSTTSRG